MESRARFAIRGREFGASTATRPCDEPQFDDMGQPLFIRGMAMGDRRTIT